VLLSTLIVAISPFIYFFLTKGAATNSSGGSVILLVMFIGILLAGFVAPFLFVGKSSFLVLLLLYMLFVLLHLFACIGITSIAKNSKSKMTGLSIYVWMTAYLIIIFAPFLSPITIFP